MKFFIAFALLMAAAAAVPVDPSKDAVVKTYSFDNIGVGPYSYEYETSDGKFVSEQAVRTDVGTENEAHVVSGRYAFVAPNGVLYEVTYTADKNGFHPSGAHIPQ